MTLFSLNEGCVFYVNLHIDIFWRWTTTCKLQLPTWTRTHSRVQVLGWQRRSPKTFKHVSFWCLLFVPHINLHGPIKKTSHLRTIYLTVYVKNDTLVIFSIPKGPSRKLACTLNETHNKTICIHHESYLSLSRLFKLVIRQVMPSWIPMTGHYSYGSSKSTRNTNCATFSSMKTEHIQTSHIMSMTEWVMTNDQLEYEDDLLLLQFIMHSPPTTLDSPIIVSHNKFLEPMMILIIIINVSHIIIQPMLEFS